MRKEAIEQDAHILYKDLQLASKDELDKLKKKRKKLQAKMDAEVNDPIRKYVGGRMIFIDLAGNEVCNIYMYI